MAKFARKELLELFFEEVESYIPEIHNCLGLLEEDSHSAVAIEELHRLFHNIKGAASQVDLPDLSSAARLVESALSDIFEAKQACNSSLIETIKIAAGLLNSFAEARTDSADTQNELYQKILTMMQSSAGVAKSSAGEKVEGWSDCIDGVHDVFPLLQEMISCLGAEEDVERHGFVYERISKAVVLLAQTVQQVGMNEQARLFLEFDDIVNQLKDGVIVYQPEIVGLLGDYFQFLAVVFFQENPESDSLVNRVRQQLSTIQSLLKVDAEPPENSNQAVADGDSKLASEQVEEHGVVDDYQAEEESMAFLLQLDDSELFEGTDDLDFLDDESEVDDNPAEQPGRIIEEPVAVSHKVIAEIPSLDENNDQEESAAEQQLIMDVFREECDEHLIVINDSLNFLETQVVETVDISEPLRDCLSDMRRAMHTLKGAAAITGMTLLADCAHCLEDMLDWLHDKAKEIRLQEVRLLAEGIDLIELLSQAPDVTSSPSLDSLVSAVGEYLATRSDLPEPSVMISDTMVDNKLSVGPISREVSFSEENWTEESAEVDDGLEVLPGGEGTLRVKIDDLEELVSIEGELVVARGAMEKMVEEFSQTLIELDGVKENLRRKSQELESGFEVQALYGVSGGQVKDGVEALSQEDLTDFDPIELDRYSQLNLLIRSLNEISVDVNSISTTLASLNADISGQVGKQQLTMRLMQEKLMRIRMTPLSSISRLLFRTVRETAASLDKQVTLTVVGEDVYMDRFVWAKITDPLIHLLRNSVDHGIESAEIRRNRGKTITGGITLEAEQRSRYVVLRLTDDGGGVDLDALRAKLQKMKLVENPANLREAELLDYLFHPSFTTKDDVSRVSGRGVGLDVVKKNIENLRGKVTLQNHPDEGVTFEVLIPFTLSVNRAVLVSVAGKEFAIPLQDVQQIKHFSREELDSSISPALPFEGGLIPYKNLGYYLQLEGKKSGMPLTAKGVLALFFNKGDEQFAVSIDAVVEQREIVVKSLGSHLSHVHGISGVTLTGAGDMLPILNLRELIEIQPEIEVLEDSIVSDLERLEPLKVLIVDDSISVRHSVARLIESQSWKQQQAVDGLDALGKLEEFKPDVIVLDVEMPRMNGYEFKSNLNNHEEFKNIPVVMLTSRSSEKHRQKGAELGVSHYLTKPYQEEPFVRLLASLQNDKI